MLFDNSFLLTGGFYNKHKITPVLQLTIFDRPFVATNRGIPNNLSTDDWRTQLKDELLKMKLF